jgi:hypothetical protein
VLIFAEVITLRESLPVAGKLTRSQNHFELGSYNCEEMNTLLHALCCTIVLAVSLQTQAQSNEKVPEKVPMIDGNAGPCSAELTVLGADGKPAYAATVKVHIKYGFGGMHRLDLEAGSNSDGKVKFIGIPARVQRPPLEFRATKAELSGIAVVDPSTQCQAKYDITLAKWKAQDSR